ncbi:hypothetical protein EMIHUDRAFT_456734 [Emiliania huxleyi CCMP1516]|uniref:Cyclic nucleotide-binding domain-containing protein n=2 Tax=Emiliania huxleyi TaxID=2903 RepID=A0A0D3K1U9_EMIH1|nr:hypothetical protein EMIHUDRAFT_456734 [Emiliania huxleyi CCMP1516]EOD29734.1 hypothetical protein EMIHUDRAFT_456734 [Emiliania huxleyi CCMP1516]|eukprot:XP_005782163.1 hypothetical protein EMIHUDRAFT_456734 [Emiliania huxleyi CCMP1516]
MLSKLPRAAARARLAAQPACRARSSIASRASRASRLPRFPPRDSDAPRPDAARRARSSIAPAESSIADPASLTWSPPSEPEPPSSLLPLWLVHRARALLPVIGHSAYITLASGFLMTDVLALRLMLIGGYSGLVAFHALHERPLRIPFRWSVFFVVVNGVMALKLVRDRYPGAFGEEEESIYEGSFTQLSRGQFKRLMALATVETLPEGAVLTTERAACPHLYFVLDGSAQMRLNGEAVAVIGRGGFCNTLAYQRGELSPPPVPTPDPFESKKRKPSPSLALAGEPGTPAYGTIRGRSPMRVVRWELAALRDLTAAGVHVQDYLGAKPTLRPSLTEAQEAAEAMLGTAPGGAHVVPRRPSQMPAAKAAKAEHAAIEAAEAPEGGGTAASLKRRLSRLRPAETEERCAPPIVDEGSVVASAEQEA